MDKQGLKCREKEFIISDKVLNSFRHHELIKNDAMDTSISIFHMLRHMAFIFDMNYTESLKIVKNKNIINLKCDEILSKFDEDSIKEIKNICNKYIEERIN